MRDVCFTQKADLCSALAHVRWGQWRTSLAFTAACASANAIRKGPPIEAASSRS